ncbi:MAG: protein-L-isoaspartate(D-aspartate) O-methyltransferase [bacterium]
MISSCQPEDIHSLRMHMIESQIIKRGITDQRVIAAMKKLPRHEFLPKEKQHLAYDDHPVQIGFGQTMSQPYIVALMSELADISEHDRVLEIGTGSGYQAAILAEISKEVYTIEIIPELASRAEETLTELKYSNITVKAGDGFFGWPEHAPFDAVVVTAAPSNIPQPLLDQLKIGGRLVIPVGTYPYQELKKIIKTEDEIIEDTIIPVLFVPMTGEARKGS